jgi:PAS domain S-box-containing protein
MTTRTSNTHPKPVKAVKKPRGRAEKPKPVKPNRTRRTKTLRESEAYYRLLFESNPLPMWVYDIETLRFTAVNDVAVEHYGYSRDEFLSMTIKDIRPLEDLPRLETHLAKLRQPHQRSGPWKHRKKDGTLIDVEIISHDIKFLDRPARLVLANDITERKRAEAEIVKLHRAIESSGEVIFLTDRGGVITYVNPEFTNLYGYAAVEVIGQTTPRILKSGRMELQDYELFWKTILSGQVIRAEYINRAKDGRLIEIDGSASSILDDQGNIIGFLAVQRDITARKRAEAALRESEAKYRDLVDEVNDGFYMSDLDGVLTFVNRALARVLGFDHPEALVGRNFLEFVPPAKVSELTERYQAAMATGTGTELITTEIVRRDGTSAFIEIKPQVMMEGGRRAGNRGTLRDITERKRAEESFNSIVVF